MCSTSNARISAENRALFELNLLEVTQFHEKKIYHSTFFRNMGLLLFVFRSFQFCLSIKIFSKPQELRFANTQKTEQKQIGKDISTLLSL